MPKVKPASKKTQTEEPEFEEPKTEESVSEEIEAIFVGKISPKTIGLDKNTLRKIVPESGVKPVARVYGMLTDVKTGTSDHGDWTRFDGQIEAVNMETGEIFRFGKIFLPDPVTPCVEADLIIASAKDGFVGMGFAYEIQIKSSEVPIGYEYQVRSLLQKKAEADPLLQMRNQFKIKLIAK